MRNNVYIEGGDQFYRKMWEEMGYTVVNDSETASVIQFTGGEDVNPLYYDEKAHPTTHSSDRRDQHCFGLFSYAVTHGLPMAGICRGGQFLNVANGGKMFQDCDGHATGHEHVATILETGLQVGVTSTHHQIMRPNREKGIVLMEAQPKLSTYKRHMELETANIWHEVDGQEEDDVESVFYPETMSLCYQPHPEWCKTYSDCMLTYKYFLRNHLGLPV